MVINRGKYHTQINVMTFTIYVEHNTKTRVNISKNISKDAYVGILLALSERSPTR